jgi:hypothetical protein
MTEVEKERLNAGALDYQKQEEEMEQQIREEIEKTLPHLTPEAKEAVLRSRLGIWKGTETTQLVKGDLGKNAGKKIKDSLF